MSTTLLLDADIIAYQFASAVQKNYQWDENTLSIDITSTDAEIMEGVDRYLLALQDMFSADRMIVCLSDPEVNFRKSILPTYKGNRTGPKPVKLMWLKGAFSDKYETYQRPTLEADDVMGILSTHPTLIPGKKIIVSEDKDMKTIPGWLYNPNKDRDAHLVEEHDADYFHMFQTLTGDAVDNYKGCPKIGPVNAQKILMDGEDMRHFSMKEMWSRVVATYEAKGLTEADALVQAQCAKILRFTDYNFKKKAVKLWQPPK